MILEKVIFYEDTGAKELSYWCRYCWSETSTYGPTLKGDKRKYEKRSIEIAVEGEG